MIHILLHSEEEYKAPRKLPFNPNNVKRFYLPNILLVESYKLTYALCLYEVSCIWNISKCKFCSVLTLFFFKYWLFIALVGSSKYESQLLVMFLRFCMKMIVILKDHLNSKVCRTWHFIPTFCFRL